VNEELEKFYEESNKQGDLKVPVDFVSKNYKSESGMFVVEPKMKKTQIKKKKIWTGNNKSKGLF
tara:strand:+ start:74 stop:265 length:192 start_codon:yes stop_codon:yes gene_type:complete